MKNQPTGTFDLSPSPRVVAPSPVRASFIMYRHLHSRHRHRPMYHARNIDRRIHQRIDLPAGAGRIAPTADRQNRSEGLAMHYCRHAVYHVRLAHCTIITRWPCHAIPTCHAMPCRRSIKWRDAFRRPADQMPTKMMPRAKRCHADRRWIHLTTVVRPLPRHTPCTEYHLSFNTKINIIYYLSSFICHLYHY